MRALRALAILVVAVSLAGCVGERPDGATCSAVSTASANDASLTSTMAGKWAIPHSQPRQHVDILVLSGGGAWGSYGAGFLNGWSARDAALGGARPQFDVVTGVSTGAIIAPFALLGPKYDPLLEEAYRGSSSEDLFRSRPIISLPFWDSINTPDPIEKRLTRTLDDSALAALVKAYDDGRSLWAGAVNFDTGHFTEFNLTALAKNLPPDDARSEIVDRLLAASAIPGFFPPRFIHGCMFMDGGVRENLFISQIGGAVGAAIGPHGGGATVNIYAILNGNIAPSPRITDNTLFDIGVRGFELAADQIQLASLREIYDYAHANGFHLYWTSADDVVIHQGDTQFEGRCSAPLGMTDQFNAAFTACLFDKAKLKAETDRKPWRTDRP